MKSSLAYIQVSYSFSSEPWPHTLFGCLPGRLLLFFLFSKSMLLLLHSLCYCVLWSTLLFPVMVLSHYSPSVSIQLASPYLFLYLKLFKESQLCVRNFSLRVITESLNIWQREVKQIVPCLMDWFNLLCLSSHLYVRRIAYKWRRWAAGSAWKALFSLSPSHFLLYIYCAERKQMIYEANRFLNEHTALQHATLQTCWWERQQKSWTCGP